MGERKPHTPWKIRIQIRVLAGKAIDNNKCDLSLI